MNQLTSSFASDLNAIAMLVVYADNEGHHYLETHKVYKETIGAGQPVSEEFMIEISQQMKMKDFGPMPNGPMPANILYLDQRTSKIKMAWYTPPSERNVFFSKALKISSGKMHFPGMIYYIEGRNIWMFAYKGQSRPVPGTALYRAPLFNTAMKGSVCLGTAQAEYPIEPNYTNLQVYWETMLFLAEFSHLAGNINPTHRRLEVICRELVKSGKPFPHNDLVPMGMKLEDILTNNINEL
jgi:PRTRC genetic system protein B